MTNPINIPAAVANAANPPSASLALYGPKRTFSVTGLAGTASVKIWGSGDGITFPTINATPLLVLHGESQSVTLDDLSLAYRCLPSVGGGIVTVDAQIDCCAAGAGPTSIFGTGAAGDVVVDAPNTPVDPAWVDTRSFTITPTGSVLIGPEQELTVRATTSILINGPILGAAKWSLTGPGAPLSVSRLQGSVVGGSGGGGGGGGAGAAGAGFAGTAGTAAVPLETPDYAIGTNSTGGAPGAGGVGGVGAAGSPGVIGVPGLPLQPYLPALNTYPAGPGSTIYGGLAGTNGVGPGAAQPGSLGGAARGGAAGGAGGIAGVGGLGGSSVKLIAPTITINASIDVSGGAGGPGGGGTAGAPAALGSNEGGGGGGSGGGGGAGGAGGLIMYLFGSGGLTETVPPAAAGGVGGFGGLGGAGGAGDGTGFAGGVGGSGTQGATGSPGIVIRHKVA